MRQVRTVEAERAVTNADARTLYVRECEQEASPVVSDAFDHTVVLRDGRDVVVRDSHDDLQGRSLTQVHPGLMLPSAHLERNGVPQPFGE